MEVDIDRLLATTHSTCFGLGDMESSLCSKVTHFKWKEGVATPRQAQSVSAILWKVSVLAVTKANWPTVSSGSIVTTTEPGPPVLLLIRADATELSVLDSSTRVETADSCTIVAVLLWIDGGSTQQMSSPSSHSGSS